MRARRILIADDEEDIRVMLSTYLRAEGFDVSTTADGAETVERVRAEKPDLVVLDVGMPSLDGFEVLRRIRSDSDVPVIMLTARTEEVDRVAGLMVG
ncbi:response regulator, partial [bacterium]|nr:response regulator [bacterium]